MAVGSRRQRAAPDIWPGFVDAISALLIIMIFVLIVFALAQFFLSADLSNRNDALKRLNLEVAELAEMLSIERSANSDLRDNLSQMSIQLATSIADRDRLSNQLGELGGVDAAGGDLGGDGGDGAHAVRPPPDEAEGADPEAYARFARLDRFVDSIPRRVSSEREPRISSS